jgi:Retroviral aspartyl protease.
LSIGSHASAGTDPFKEGIRLYNNGQYDDALARFRSCVGAGNQPAQSTFYMASCYQQLGQTSEAKSTFRQVLYKFPNTAIGRRASMMLANINAQVNEQLKTPPAKDSFWDDPAALKVLSRPSQDVSVKYLKDTDQGWILMPATINGVEVKMLLDTGAAISTCNQSFLDSQGIRVTETKSKMTLVGAAGEVITHNVIATIGVGTIKREVLLAVLQDQHEKSVPQKPQEELSTPPSSTGTGSSGASSGNPNDTSSTNTSDASTNTTDGGTQTTKKRSGTGRHVVRPLQAPTVEPPILGQNFLKNFQYTIDDPAETVTFYGDRKSLGVAPGKDVPYMSDADGAIFVHPKINGKECEMQLDTGAALITLADRHLSMCGVNIPAESLKQKGAAGIGGSKEGYRFKIDNIQLGKVAKKLVDARVLLDTRFRKPLLGQAFLQGLKYTIDPFRKVVRFE